MTGAGATVLATDRWGNFSGSVGNGSTVQTFMDSGSNTLSFEDLSIVQDSGFYVPASPLMRISDIATDPHFRGRGTIVPVLDEDYGEMLMTAPIPRMSETPGTIRSLGPRIGNGNEAVFGTLLGMTAEEMERLRAAGTI